MIGGRTAAGRNRGRTGGRSAGDSGGRSGRGWRGVSRNRGRQIAAVVAAAYAGAGGGAHSCRPRGQRKPPAGRGTAGTAAGSHQPGDRAATTAPGRDGPPPAGAEQATKARANASGQAEDHTKRARALARPREVGTPAPAKGTAGPQAKPCGFGSAKFF